MTWNTYFRRMVIELLLFLLSCSVVFYLVSGRESVSEAITMGVFATLFYGVVTFVLRQRAIRNQEDRPR